MPAKSPDALQSAQSMLTELGAQIRARRKRFGISATAAAESAGISRVTWYRIERGEASVAVGAWANAAHVLGLACRLGAEEERISAGPPAREGWLPARIVLADYPELRKLAWQVSEGEVLTPREALSIYQRNQRYLDAAALTARERALIAALEVAMASDV